MANMMQMMQKAQKFKSGMADLQARVQQMDVEGSAGGGLVSCRMTGGFEMKSIKIDPSLLSAAEAEVLEDLIIAAVNDGKVKAEKLMKDETQKLMNALGLPPGLMDQLPI